MNQPTVPSLKRGVIFLELRACWSAAVSSPPAVRSTYRHKHQLGTKPMWENEITSTCQSCVSYQIIPTWHNWSHLEAKQLSWNWSEIFWEWSLFYGEALGSFTASQHLILLTAFLPRLCRLESLDCRKLHCWCISFSHYQELWICRLTQHCENSSGTAWRMFLSPSVILQESFISRAVKDLLSTDVWGLTFTCHEVKWWWTVMPGSHRTQRLLPFSTPVNLWRSSHRGPPRSAWAMQQSFKCLVYFLRELQVIHILAGSYTKKLKNIQFIFKI